MDEAQYFRDKATQCRQLAAHGDENTAYGRGLLALALEFDARALAFESAAASQREIEPEQRERTEGSASGNGGSEPKST
jgi:hypothetical protein